jgi:hypothetical protein
MACTNVEYASEVASSGDTHVTPKYDSAHGSYKETEKPAAPTANPMTKHDPKPFGSMQSPK